jgi:site-specific DNA-cytosine methylase
MNELALFSGAGGGILGGKLLGWRTICAVEWEAYPASVLCARQNDGLLPPFPIWDDVQTFDGKPWRGIVDVISGGFPCQDISAAGKGVGIDGERSGMWGEMARIIHEVRPRFVFVENSPMLTSRGLGRVLGDLASMGFDARWGVLGAADIGANHQRDRIWIVARWKGDLPHAQHDRIRWWEQQQKSIEEETREMANSNSHGLNYKEQRELGKSAIQTETRQKFNQIRRHSILVNARCQLRDEGNSGHLDTQEEIGTSSPIFNQSSGEGCGEDQVDNANCEGLERNNNIQKSSLGVQQKPGERCDQVSDSTGIRPQGQREHEQSINSEKGRKGQAIEPVYGRSPDFWAVEPNVGRVAHGLADRVDRLKAIGNGQVPLCAATAWRILSERN